MKWGRMARGALVLIVLLLTCVHQKYQGFAYKVMPNNLFSTAAYWERLNPPLYVQSERGADIAAAAKFPLKLETKTSTSFVEVRTSECLVRLKNLNERVKQMGYTGDPSNEIESILSSCEEDPLSLKHGMIMINIYKSCGQLKEGFKVIDILIRSGIIPDTYIYNNLINGCAKNSDHLLAERVLQYMTLQGVPKDHWTYTAAIKSFAKAGFWDRAVQFLNDMENEGIPPDTVTYSAAISACASKGRVKEAVELLGEMIKKDVPTDTIIYNSVIDAAAQAGKADIALSIFNHMYKVSISRDIYTFTSVIAACDKSNDFHSALMIFDKMIDDGIALKSPPFNSIIHTAFRVGKPGDAMRLYHRMLAMNVQPSIVTYTILMTYSSRNGVHVLHS